MQIAFIASEATTAAWSSSAGNHLHILSIQMPEEAPEGALLADLLFDGTEIRVSQLRAHKGPVWVNDVAGTLPAGNNFVRFNGWSGFEKSSRIEVAGNEAIRAEAEGFATALGKELEWLPDAPGFVTPRVIASIINEAYHALSEGVSTREDINTAMKLGTNYPHGPFEWASIIGLKNIRQLLLALERVNQRYTPNSLLLQEAEVNSQKQSL
jgi:3-hydroxybutyryl-CoA dehydrogenase